MPSCMFHQYPFTFCFVRNLTNIQKKNSLAHACIIRRNTVKILTNSNKQQQQSTASMHFPLGTHVQFPGTTQIVKKCYISKVSFHPHLSTNVLMLPGTHRNQRFHHHWPEHKVPECPQEIGALFWVHA